jgi:hypothetical protein
VTAEAQDSGTVAVVEDLEGRCVAAADVPDQLLVGESGENTAWLRKPQTMRPGS